MSPSPTIIVVMGVSGSGKSTIAGALAGRLDWDLKEGDDLHSAANVDKMARGVALTDDDRWPWLHSIATWIDAQIDSGRSGVVTCSALARRYRDVLRRDAVWFVYLGGSEELIQRRLTQRHGHFMPPSLLESQLSTLEPPEGDEQAITVPLGREASDIARELATRFARPCNS